MKSYHELLSEEVLPSIWDIFLSMAYHFVLENYKFEPDNMMDIYKEMDNGCRDLKRLRNLSGSDARRKNLKYKGNWWTFKKVIGVRGVISY